MRFLVDTNIWILFLKSRSSKVSDRLRVTPPTEIAVCAVVWAELLHGALKYGDVKRREAIVTSTLQSFCSLPFDDSAAREYALIRHELELSGQIIGPNDLMIAAIAKSHGLTVVTYNREFSRVGGLKVDDWSL